MAIADPVNLVLLYAPGVLDVEDYKKIALRVRGVAPNVEVYIHQDRTPDPALVQRLASRRTLVFSPTQVKEFMVSRGRVYAGRPMNKSEQMLRLQLAGVPVPAWATLDRGKRFDPGVWGELVVVKPEISSLARGVRIVNTRSLNDAGANVQQYKRGGNNFVVQKLVFNPTYGKIRIQLLFDEVLFARRFCFPEPIRRLDTAEDVQAYQRMFETDNVKAENYDSADVFELAKRCVRAFDGVALFGLDVLLDETGNPYFIEANPGGNTWHFSSAARGQMLKARGVFLEEQFGAFDRAGEVLAQRALAEAI
jgi:ATP-grasp domain